MQSMSYLVLEMVSAERERELSSVRHRMLMRAQDELADAPGVRRSLAAGLVRLGLRLDPAAGEGLGVRALSLAATNGGGSR